MQHINHISVQNVLLFVVSVVPYTMGHVEMNINDIQQCTYGADEDPDEQYNNDIIQKLLNANNF